MADQRPQLISGLASGAHTLESRIRPQNVERSLKEIASATPMSAVSKELRQIRS
jgi:hypothetical protein